MILQIFNNANVNRTHYTLGKCLWKMYNSDDSLRTSSKRVEMQEVLDALFDAINALPQRRDSRSDPIFEPHFKLFSFVHKLVLRGKMTVSDIPFGLNNFY